MEFNLNDYLSIFFLSVATLWVYFSRKSQGMSLTVALKKAFSKYKYPPGPKGLPILGVAPYIPPEFPGPVLSEWAKKYGEMMTCQLGGMTWVFLNSSRVTREILERRSGV